MLQLTPQVISMAELWPRENIKMTDDIFQGMQLVMFWRRNLPIIYAIQVISGKEKLCRSV
jgi:hypothetical protein